MRLPGRGGARKSAPGRARAKIAPPKTMTRRKLGFPVPTAEFLAGPLHEWARDVVTSSLTDEWLDRDHVLGLLTRLREAEVPSKRIARQVWEVLVFMIWHGIFVEERIHPEIPEPVYPVRL